MSLYFLIFLKSEECKTTIIALIFKNRRNSFLKLSLRKSVQIRSFSWSLFSRVQAEYGEILRISPNAGKYGPEKTPYLDIFHTASLLYLQKYFINENKNYIFMIWKDWSFCNQNEVRNSRVTKSSYAKWRHTSSYSNCDIILGNSVS